MSTDITGSINAAIQKIGIAKTAIQQVTTIRNNTETPRLYGFQFGESGSFQESSYDREFTRGIKDSNTIFDRQSKLNISTTYEPIAGKNIFDQSNREITTSKIEVTENGETVFKDEFGNESTEKDKSWLDQHSTTRVNVAGDKIDSLTHENSVIGATFENEHNKLEVNALGYETGADYSVGIENGKINAQMNANAEVYLFKGEYEGRYGPAYGKGEVFVGAEATASLEANFDPKNGDVNASAKAEAFAGGKAEASAGLEGDNGKLGGNAGVTYGVGGELGGDIGMKDGKVKAKVDIGATVGLGFDVGFEAEVDVKETAKDVTGWIPGTPW